MATMTFQVVAGQTYAHTKTISAGHLTRLAAAERALRNMPNATDAQIVQEIANDIYAQLRARVLEYERREVAKTASDAVAEITLT